MNMQKFDQGFIDAALDDVLMAGGRGLGFVTPEMLDRMRMAMGDALKAAYMTGSDDCHKALTENK